MEKKENYLALLPFFQATNPFSNYLSCPVIRWVGIHPSDISPLAVESSQLKNQDVKKINSLLDRPYVQNNLQLKNQVSQPKLMLPYF